MILHLYNHIGSSRHGDITLPDSLIPRIGEWLHFPQGEHDSRKGIYRTMSVDYTIDHGKLVPELTAHEASGQHYERAKTAIHTMSTAI
jgi:hypothetical protein